MVSARLRGLGTCDYASFANSPIWKSDKLGDEVKATPEASKVIQGGVQGVLGEKKSPIGYDEKSQLLTYDNSVDVTGFTPEQSEVVTRYKTLIQSKTDFVNVQMVDKDANILPGGGSLASRNANGATQSSFRIRPIESMKSAGILNVVGTESNVYIARNPSQINTVISTSNDVRIASTREVSNERLPNSYSKFVSLHEIIGHAYVSIPIWQAV